MIVRFLGIGRNFLRRMDIFIILKINNNYILYIVIMPAKKLKGKLNQRILKPNPKNKRKATQWILYLI